MFPLHQLSVLLDNEDKLVLLFYFSTHIIVLSIEYTWQAVNQMLTLYFRLSLIQSHVTLLQYRHIVPGITLA